MRKVNKRVISELKKPWGEIYKTKELIEKINGRKVISVGDICSHKLIDNGLIPHICIYDGISQRKKVDKKLKNFFENYYNKIILVENEAGTINPLAELSLISLIDSEMPGALNVKGEEDLLSLVAIIHLPKDYVVVYGQPRKGAVLVEYSKEIKEKAKKIYNDML